MILPYALVELAVGHLRTTGPSTIHMENTFDRAEQRGQTQFSGAVYLVAAITAQAERGESFKPSGRVAVVHNVHDFYPPMFTGIFQIQSAIREFSSVADHIVMMPNRTNPELKKSVEAICEAIGVTHTIFYDTAETDRKACSARGNLLKVYALNLEKYVAGYERAVLLDVDVVAMRNFDDVFAYPGVSMAFWTAGHGTPNGGVVVFEPAKVDFACVLDGFDQIVARSDLKTPSEASCTFGSDDDDQRFLMEWLATRRA